MSRLHWLVSGALLMALNLSSCASYDAEKAQAEAERQATAQERAEQSHRQMDRALDNAAEP
ncbi:hypothetical protein [Thiomicrospira sp. WB1]|uniref:hypothetical protein n=1 Tax=Thiomicrospira sp. WB1 TaxID=1685380 RepID=UPI0008397B43|nr:hypothetical protein [Thiomicrospira sp. WB1]